MRDYDRMLHSVAELEKVTLQELDSRYRRYFVPVNPSLPDRCVDGRKCDDKNFFGGQFPAATLGILDNLIFILDIDETRARRVISSTYKKNKLKLGAHIDDKHGEITGEKLHKRIKGCGNQKKAGEGELSVVKPFNSPNILGGRLKWIRDNGGFIAVLRGKHNEKLPIININSDLTFNSNLATYNKYSAFNFDFTETLIRSGYLYAQITSEGLNTKSYSEEDFCTSFATTLTRNYIQTVRSLTGQTSFYLNR